MAGQYRWRMIQLSIRKELSFAEGKKPLTIDVTLPAATITAVYGESGAGKTSLLKMIAGLLLPEQGFIKVDDAVWFDTEKKVNLPPQQRSIGFVFQGYALFPNMTVLQNLQYAAGKGSDKTFIHHLIETVSLQSFLHTKPGHLSGGQQQRAALIRALVRKPQLLLLDEPLAALGNKMREDMHIVLQVLQQQLHFTALLVSHDEKEIAALAKRVIQLEGGSLVFEGTPRELFYASNQLILLPAKVISIIREGIKYRIEVKIETGVLIIAADIDKIGNLKINDTVTIDVKTSDIRIMQQE